MKDKVELDEETSDIESTTKLTKWKNEPSISDLQSDLESAESIIIFILQEKTGYIFMTCS